MAQSNFILHTINTEKKLSPLLVFNSSLDVNLLENIKGQWFCFPFQSRFVKMAQRSIRSRSTVLYVGLGLQTP